MAPTRRAARRAAPVAALAIAVGVGCVPAAPAAQQVPSTGENYVSLGDSWVSGPLIGPLESEIVPIDCGQSTDNFPHRIANLLRVRSFVDMSCGGADVDDLWEVGEAPLGSPTRPQFDGLRADTTLVTIGMSGNDAGISGLALDCVNILPIPLGPPPFGRSCIPDFVTDEGDKISVKIAKAAVELRDALAEIRRRSPDAEVFVLGYGSAFPDDGDGCWPQAPMLGPDVHYVRSKMLELNDAIRAEAAAAGPGFHYVDMWALSRGHDLCQPPGVSWLNAASLDPAGIPAHPNILYHRAVAPMIVEQILADASADGGRVADPKG